MLLKRVDNIFIVLIILCSTSFYSLTVLGPAQKIIELIGVGLIVMLLLLHLVYSKEKTIKLNFIIPVLLILFSLLTSMFMAKLSRNQNFAQTMYAQKALYYYLFYLVLHQLKTKTEFLERIFIFLGFLHVFLYLVQFFLYPRILFDVFILQDRGTIRIYMKGSDYLALSYFISIQAFLRTNKIKYLLYTLIFYSIFVLLGGRQTMAIMAFCLVLFILFSKKVKSRVFIIFLVFIAVSSVFFMFQDIFQMLVIQSRSDASLGKEYIRLLAANYFLTDFFKNPFAYITGNGMFANNSAYGHEIMNIMLYKRFYLGDVGLIGNYAIYGAFFIIGVFSICYKALKLKINDKHTYIKYMILAIVLSLITGGGFAAADFICSIACIIYIIDISNYSFKKQIV